MPKRNLLLLLSILTFGIFTIFSFTVAKEVWQKSDFDATVKLQDHIPRRFDELFSYFSYLGSAEVTIGIALILSVLSLIRKKILTFLAWLIIVPASFFEVFGKLVIFHPAPPEFFHRNILTTSLPSFYIHTNFSYPSGHMTRTIFIVTTFVVLVIYSRKSFLFKLISLSLLFSLAIGMGVTRVYLGEHWLTDVIGGSLLGMASGIFASALIIRTRLVNMGK